MTSNLPRSTPTRRVPGRCFLLRVGGGGQVVAAAMKEEADRQRMFTLFVDRIPVAITKVGSV